MSLFVIDWSRTDPRFNVLLSWSIRCSSYRTPELVQPDSALASNPSDNTVAGAGTVTDTGVDGAETFPAASIAATEQEYVIPTTTPTSTCDSDAVVAIAAPSRRTSYRRR